MSVLSLSSTPDVTVTAGTVEGQLFGTTDSAPLTKVVETVGATLSIRLSAEWGHALLNRHAAADLWLHGAHILRPSMIVPALAEIERMYSNEAPAQILVHGGVLAGADIFSRYTATQLTLWKQTAGATEPARADMSMRVVSPWEDTRLGEEAAAENGYDLPMTAQLRLGLELRARCGLSRIHSGRKETHSLTTRAVLTSCGDAALIEGVYTRRDQRGRGFARTALTSALHEAARLGRTHRFAVTPTSLEESYLTRAGMRPVGVATLLRPLH